jgi:hypothetical protein
MARDPSRKRSRAPASGGITTEIRLNMEIWAKVMKLAG